MADSSGGDWLGFLGLLGAAGLASAGAIYNNRQQRKLQEKTNDTAINLANTAHQREVDDLRAAGLNPILSASGSGAATPSLGTAQLDNVMDSFGSNARAIGEMASKQRGLQNQHTQAQIAQIKADTNTAKATAKNLAVQNRNLDAQTANIVADTELKKKQAESRTALGGAIEDIKTHSAPVVSGAKGLSAALKDLYQAKKTSDPHRSQATDLFHVSPRTLEIMRKKGMSDEEIRNSVYEYLIRKASKK